MATDKLTDDQQACVMEFARLMGEWGACVARLNDLGLDLKQALQAIPAEDGSTLWDQIPAHFRLML